MLILVRHGRTAANASGLLLGRLDPELDELGVQQAEAVAAALADGHPVRDGIGGIGRIVASPLGRTRATAEAIGRRCGVAVELDEQWLELDYGDYDGLPLADVPSSIWKNWRVDSSFAPPNGESIAALGERVRAALDVLAPDAHDENVVVVSHVSPIKAAVAWALGVGDEVAWRMFLAPASITRVAVSERGPSLTLFNDTSHLG
jgi:broad specificity phosphatase PhoE